MRAEIISMTEEKIDKEGIERAGEILKNGGLSLQRRFTDLEETLWTRRLP